MEDVSITQQKVDIVTKLEVIDKKSIRALRTNEISRLLELEAEARALREQLASI